MDDEKPSIDGTTRCLASEDEQHREEQDKDEQSEFKKADSRGRTRAVSHA